MTTDVLPPMPEVIAATWVCVRRRRLLVVRTTGQDAFYLPGGTPEPGETLAQTTAREVAEETGIVLRPEDLRPLVEILAPAHGRPGTRVRMVTFTADSDQHPRAAAEIAEVAWFTSADSARCAPAVADLLARLTAQGDVD